LFQIFAETLRAASKKYNTVIPFYIMTSPLNYAATVAIFETADYYGLGEENVFIFRQGTLPNFGFDGKILMAAKDQIASSPDGHGGSLKALYVSGAAADMKKRGVEYLSYWQVDNPLVKLIDPLFIGLHAMDKAEMSSKALVKAGPLEKVGNFCLVDGKVTVIEYSDLPDEQAHRKNPDGSLVFELGSIGIHIISRSFVEKLNKGGDFALPFHRAVKKIPCIDKNGTLIQPDKPNGVKLETFVFDALPMAERSVILQTLRREEFAPVKNASGTDSPEVTRRMMSERAANWLQQAGARVPRKPDGSPDCVLELAPSFALEPEDVKAQLDRIPPLKPGCQLYLE
jgi:UDP-N-acetylglucosamine/UDP-N-acetylgalactosamine diphosphorylase